MLQQEKQTELVNYTRACEAISAVQESCEHFATCQCTICGKWLCAAHLADELAHQCAVDPYDEGGES